MSNPYASPYSPQYPPPGYGPASQENTLGLAGFIVSLVGLVFCAAAPVGLILSLMGLRREPKVFAIIGTIIGGLTTLFYTAILAMYGAMLAACIGIGVAAQPMAQTMTSLNDARQQIENFQGADGNYPGEAEGNGLIAGRTDYWQTPLRYEPTDDGFVVRSAGADKQFNTSDDLTVDDFGSAMDFPSDFSMPPESFEQDPSSTEPKLEEEISTEPKLEETVEPASSPSP